MLTIILSTQGVPIIKAELSEEQWASYLAGRTIDASCSSKSFRMSLPISQDTTERLPQEVQGERLIRLKKVWHTVFNNITLEVPARSIPVKQFKKRLKLRKGVR